MAELTEIVGTAVQKMESKLECSICMESYKQPKLLPCYHIFCKSPCLERLVVQDRQGQSIKCPTCRHLVRLTDGVDGLKTDFHIDQLFEIRGLLKTVVESQRKSCGKCKKLPATGFCRDCGRLVCQRCTEMHQTWDDLACHTIVGLNEVLVDATKLLPLKKQVPRCEKHYKMKLKIFCSKCSEVICSDCTIGLHKDHGYDLVQDVFPKHKDEIVSGLKAIEESLNKVKETLKVFDTRAKDIHNRRAKVEADIHREIDQLHQILDQRRRDLIGSLDLLFQQSLKNLATERDSVEMLHIKMESCLNYAKVGLETGTEGEVLTMKGPLLQRVEQITTEFDPDTIQPRTEANIALVTGGLDNIRQKCQEVSKVVHLERMFVSNDLKKISSLLNQVSSKWQAIGKLLGFSNEALDKVEKNTKRGGTNARLERLLKMWISGNFGKPTVSMLVKALNAISGTKDTVRHLLEVYGDKQSEFPGTLSTGRDGQTEYGGDFGSGDKSTIKNVSQDGEDKPGGTVSQDKDRNPSGNVSQDGEGNKTSGIVGQNGKHNPSGNVSQDKNRNPSGDVSHDGGDKRPSIAMSSNSSDVNQNLGEIEDDAEIGYTITATPSNLPGLSTSSQGTGGSGQSVRRGGPFHSHGQSKSPAYSQGTERSGQLVGTLSSSYSQGTGGSGQSGTPFYSQGMGRSGQLGSPVYRQGVGRSGPSVGRGSPSYSQATSLSQASRSKTTSDQSDLQVTANIRYPQQGFQETRDNLGVGAQQGSVGASPSDGSSEQSSKDGECPICLSTVTQPTTTKCDHTFCGLCLITALHHSSYCPTCKAPLQAIFGNQPAGGTMDAAVSPVPLPGYPNCGTIEIHYAIPSGHQTERHPNSGHQFYGTRRTAYLPHNSEGMEVLHLLGKAFNAGLIFTVGNSVTSGQSNVVTWNDIHHKTNKHGGSTGYGYPDPSYLQRVKADLAAKGIVPDNSTV